MSSAAHLALASQTVGAVPVVGERWAVTVGCAGYATLPPLPSAVADTDTVAEALKSADYNVVAMTDAALDGAGVHDPDIFLRNCANLRRQLEAFVPKASLCPADTLFFYFTGHGLQLADGCDYLAPLDVPEKPTAKNLVGVAWLVKLLVDSGAGHIVVAVDVCRRTGPGVNVDGRFGEATVQSLPTNPNLQFVFLRSCQIAQQSFADELRGSVFADALADALSGGVDKPATVNAVYNYVRGSVLAETRRSGMPQVAAISTNCDAAAALELNEVTSVVLDEDDDLDDLVETLPAPDPVAPAAPQSNNAPAVTPANQPANPTPDQPAAEVVVRAQPGSDLANIVSAARPGDALRLSGTYTLASPLTIDKPLMLIGDGYDACRVVCDGERYVVRFVGEGPWTIVGVGFEHTGEAFANVVQVDGGQFTAIDCRFAGAVYDGQKSGGDGLDVNAKAVATIVGGCADGNGCAGIAFNGSAEGAVRGASCARNQYGIQLNAQAQVTLEANVCGDNADAGIACYDSVRAILRHNDCANNNVGIVVNGDSEPELEQNGCNNNKDTGIAYFGQAAGTALWNFCTRNGNYGVSLQEEAHPALESNVCQDNLDTGIVYFDASEGVARRNLCNPNKSDLIWVDVDAHPTLSDNDGAVTRG